MKRLVSAVAALFLSIVPVWAQVSVTTNRNDNARDGQNLSETILTPDNVNVNSFGKLFSHHVDGYVYAQPLYVPNVAIPGMGTHNVVFVATQHDSVYAFDADSKTGMNSDPLWHTSFLNAKKGITSVSSGDVSCGDIVPEIGITSTPVIDQTAGIIFVVAKTKQNGAFFQHLHALDITTGRELKGSPREIKARVKGNGEGGSNGYIAFDPLHQAQRPGLMLQNGVLTIGWASHCDNQPYHGWVMQYDETSLEQIAVWNSTPNGGLGGVWQSGTGIAEDVNNNLFFATGNGTYDGKKGGYDFSDTVVRLNVPVGHHIPLADWFTPYNQQQLSNEDADVGSGGVLLLPDQPKGSPYEHLLIQVGKTGSIYLINRDGMGHFHANGNHIVQDMEGAIGGLWSTAAWWNNNVYFGGSYDTLRQYTFDSTTGLLSTGAEFTSPTYFNFPGPTPSISANQDSNPIVWALQTDAYGSNGSSILHAYDGTNVGTELYNTTQNDSRDDPGGAVKFTVPTVANGKVYVGAVKRITVYGVLN
jgi:hypothetical protein